MRSSNLNYAHGTTGNPQTDLEQLEYAAKVSINEEKLKEFAENLELIDPVLIAQMEEDGVKFNKEEVLMTTRDSTGQIIWLEKGNKTAGYEHMKHRKHDVQLAEYLGTNVAKTTTVLRNIIAYGKVTSNELVIRHGRPGYERKYEYNGKRIILAAIGTNGFLVTAYPDD